MTATLIQSPDRIVLRNISWQTYQSQRENEVLATLTGISTSTLTQSSFVAS